MNTYALSFAIPFFLAFAVGKVPLPRQLNRKVDESRYQRDPLLDQDATFLHVDVRNLDGVSWTDAPLPRRWHRCWAQTDGWTGLTQVQRCACGAMRTNRNPENALWFDRNSSRRGRRRSSNTPVESTETGEAGA